jgi:regulatory protein
MPRPGGADKLAARKARLERHATETSPDVVLNAAARFLEARQRSVHEMRRHLTAAAYPADLIERAIGRLMELRMLDDETFARTWVESRDRAHPRGRQALQRELALKGIERSTAQGVLDDRARGATDGAEAGDIADNPGDGESSADEVAASRLLARRAGALARVADPRVRRQRAYALLARNGFDAGVCREVSAHFVNQHDDEADPLE